jgi:hypothetical protein
MNIRGKQVTLGYLVDVIVGTEYRGLGISMLSMDDVVNHHTVKNIRRFTLATLNAHGLYEQFGFSQLSKPDSFMHDIILIYIQISKFCPKLLIKLLVVVKLS